MNSVVAGVLVLGMFAMAIGLAMLYLQTKGIEGMLGDVVRMVDGVDVRAKDVQDKVDHLIVRGKRGPRKKAAPVVQTEPLQAAAAAYKPLPGLIAAFQPVNNPPPTD